MANVTKFTPQNAEPEAPQPTVTTVKKGRFGGKPPKPKPPIKAFEGKQPQFFERVNNVPAEDWGTRAFMYVYVDEPVCNPKTWGESRYLLKSSAPIRDLEGLKQDYGSFKGWMSLNLRKTGKDATDEVDRLNFEIYDPKFPPKIPRGAWANDGRNKRWIDLLPPEKPESAGAGSMLDAMRMYKEIRSEVKEEVAPEPPVSTNEVLETMRAAKELFAPPNGAPTAAPAVDPLAQAMSIAKDFMQMRSENPMVDILRDELKELRAELRSEREANRKHETAAATGAKPKTLIEQLKELGEAKELIGKVLGINGDGGGIARSGKISPWQLAREVIPEVINSEFFAGLGQRIAAGANHTNGAATAAPSMSQQQTPANGQADNSEAAFQKWIRDVVNKQVIRFFLHMPGMEGGDLADLLYAMEPEWTLRLQKFEHPQLPGMIGKDAIIAGYKATQSVWPQVQQSGRTAEFEVFVQQFCEWKPEDEPMGTEPEDDGIVDLDQPSEKGAEA
jgi:hypothetical protein